MLIIDGGLQILRNILDKKLQNVSLSAFLQQERSTIAKLRSRGIITQVQYDLLFPSGGSGPATTDLDITLIICLLRNIKSLGLNKNFQWNSIPAHGDTSVEADISRLKMYRNEVKCFYFCQQYESETTTPHSAI
jgi:molybdopterin biosynthesis enzyme MoaB